MTRRLLAVVLLAAIVAGCNGGAADLSVVTKVLKRDVNAPTAGSSDPGMSIPSSGSIFWVEGKMKNSGTEEVKKVTVAFRATDGNAKVVLSAEILSVPPGKTVDFRTPIHGSRTELRLIDEDPAITVGR